MNEKTVNKLGWLASFMAIIMYFSYIDQIQLNISGQKGSILLPIITILNCIIWAFYGFSKKEKDWPIIFCGIPGIIFGTITIITAIKF